MAIDLLGPVLIDGSQVLEPRDRVALDVLAIRRTQAVSTDVLAEAIWGEELPASWQKQVQICVSRLRKVLGPESIETLAGGYRLRIDDADLDIGRFEQQIARGRGFFAAGEADRAAASYARALALWRGTPFEDLDGWGPGRIESDRLHELRRCTQEEWMEARLASGDHRAVAVEARALVAEEPLREKRWQTLAVAQYRSGRQADALRALSAARTTLREELGIDPGPDLIALEDAILNQDKQLAAIPEPAAFTDECPYKGLASYDVGDVDGFFGRATETAQCLDRLRASPVLVVAGPSGSGKSSLARAGVAAALRERGRSVVIFSPGRTPEEALAGALSAAGPDPVLVIDQFEEIWALDVPEQEVVAFCDGIAAYAERTAPVVLVIRSDYLGGLAVSPSLTRLAEQGLHLVSPLSGSALREAIELPAARVGLRLEQGLVDLLERDTEGEPGSLPLLSHALAETWRRRDGQVLTVEGYRSSGGIRGAVAYSADRLYDSLLSEQRAVLRSLMLRMVTPSLDGPPVRCRVPARSVVGDPDRDRVVALLVRSRLVTAEEDSFELAHEALARAWPRLQSWLEDDAEGQRIMRHLVTRADDWESLGRPESELFRGARLDTALEWHNQTDPDLNSTERDFLEASRRLRSAEDEQLADRVLREQQHNRRLRALLVAAGLLLVAALVGAGLASTSRDNARLEALVNQSISLRESDRTVAALLAVEAYRRSPDERAWSALLSTFNASPGFLGYQYLDDADFLSGAVVSGTDQAIVALNGGSLRLLDMASGSLSAPFDESDDLVKRSRLRVSGDGGHFVQYASQDTGRPCSGLDTECSVIRVYHLTTGNRLMEALPPFGVGQVAINDDASLVAVTGGTVGALALYRVADGELIGVVPGLGRPESLDFVWDVAGVAFGPDGLLYVGSMEGPIRVVDPDDATVIATWAAPALSSNNHLVATSDGRLVGAGTAGLVAFNLYDGSVLWTVDLRDGRDVEPCPWFAVNLPRELIYCGNLFGVVEPRSLETGARSGVEIDPQQGSVGAMSVSGDGRELVVFGAGSATVSRWRFDGSGLVNSLVAGGHVVYDGYDVAGKRLLVAEKTAAQADWDEFQDFSVWDPVGDLEIGRLAPALGGVGWVGPRALAGYSLNDDRIVFFDSATAREVPALDVPHGVENLFTAAGGTRMYVTFPGREVWTVDPDTLQRVEPTFPISGMPWAVSATQDGERVVITTVVDGEAITRVFDGRTGIALEGSIRGPRWTSVSLDGVLVGARGGEITEYDLETLEPLGVFAGARGEVNTLQFSQDGKVLLAGSNDQTVSVYDVATRRRIGDAITTFSPQIGPGHLRPDGLAIAVNQREGVVIWDIDPDHLLAAACTFAGRNLTESEWITYLAGFGEYRPTCPQLG